MSVIRSPGLGVIRGKGIGTIRVPPVPVINAPVVTGISLSPSSGTASSPAGTVIGTLSALVTNGPLANPVWSLLTSAGGDFQIVNGNQVAFLPNNVPAGSYSISVQVASSNAATFSQAVAVTISAPVTNITFPGAAGAVPTGNATMVDSTFKVDGSNNLSLANVSNGSVSWFTTVGLFGDVTATYTYTGTERNIALVRIVGPGQGINFVATIDGTIRVFRYQSGGAPQIATFSIGSIASATTVGLRVSSNQTVFTFQVNGFDTAATITDTTYPQPTYVGVGVDQAGSTKISGITISSALPVTSAGTYYVQAAKTGGVSGQTVQVSAIPSGAGFADHVTLAPVLTGMFAGAAVSPASIAPNAQSTTPAVFTVTLPTTSSQATGTIDIAASRSVSTPVSYSPSGAAPTSLGAQKLTVNSTGASAVKIDDFTLTNWGSGSSLGFARIGVLFAKGAAPAGSSLDLRRAGVSVAYQADERSTWSDGSLKRATVHLRDTSLAASAVNSYEWWTAPGTDWSNTGSKTFADLASYDLRAEIANLKQTDDGTTYATVGSGSFLSQFNTHAAVLSRVEKHHSGPVVDGWVVWGMTHDTTGGAEDAHLKVNWHVDIWKNADGSIAAVEAAPVMAQDWWSIPNKRVRQYDLAFKANGEAVTSYTGVTHIYQSHWIACVNDQSGNRGRRPWIGATMPTLLYTPNKNNWTKAGLPSLANTSRADYPNTQDLNYVPCSPADQRGAIDGTGAYDGRGAMPNVHTQCFIRPSVQNAAAARINGIAGMGFFGQFRSNRQRLRPGDSAPDIANTIIATRLYATGGVTLPNDDFRAVGMPQAVEAYGDYRTDPSMQDGYVGVNGGGVGGPAGYWNYQTQDGSHAVNYSGWSFLYEGERYFYEAMLSSALNLVNVGLGNSVGDFPSLQTQTTPRANGAPNVQYSSIACLARQERSTAWGINVSAWAAGFAPDAHPTAPFIKRFSQQQTAFLAAILQNLPSTEKAAGISPFGNSGDVGVSSPWMANFSVITGQFAARVTEDAGYKAWADMMANQVKHQVAKACFLTGAYRALVRAKAQPWAAGANEAVSPSRMVQGALQAQAAGTALRQLDGGSAPTETWSTVDVGSEVYPMSHNGDGTPTGIASAVTEGQIYYVTSVTNKGTDNPTVVLNTKADGSGTTPTFASNDAFATAVYGSGMSAQTVANGPPATANADDYQAIAYAALQEDLRANPGTADPSLVSKQGTYVGTPLGYANWANWDYAGVPS